MNQGPEKKLKKNKIFFLFAGINPYKLLVIIQIGKREE